MNILKIIGSAKTDNIDLSNVKGVKEATFRKIKSKIIENFKLAELVDEYAGVFSFSVIKKLYDKYTSIEKIKKDLQEQPYMCLCKLGGIGFKTADTLLLKCDRENIINFDTELISSPQRMLSCALYILDENENSGNTYMDLTTFKNQCIKLTPECKSEFTKVIINCDKITIDGKTKRISKTKTYNIEKYISDNLKSGLENPIIWEYDIEKYRNVNGSDLTDEQMMTMSLVCKNTITILQGYGGTGKSFSTLALINMLKDNHKSYLLLAPTGRASKVLKEYTGCSTSTIHRGLGFNPAQNKWGFDEENKLYCDIVIVDESSMIDVFLFKHLIEAIDFSRTKLLLIGDNAQLPSVSCGNLFHDLLNSNVFPTVWLRQVFRYGVGGLSTVATDIRNGDTTFKNSNNIVSIGEDKGFIYIPKSATEINGYIVKMYKQLVDNGVSIKDIMVLVSQNKGTYGTQELNNLIQNEINTNVSSKDIIKHGSTEFRVGDIIIQCVNDYNSYIYDGYGYNTEATTSIYNGDTGVIEKVETNGMVVRFDDGLIFITKEKFQILNKNL